MSSSLQNMYQKPGKAGRAWELTFFHEYLSVRRLGGKRRDGRGGGTIPAGYRMRK